MQRVALALAVAVSLWTTSSKAATPDWSKWELENSVARERDWLVIRQPGEAFCYLKQSYNRDTSKMEMMFRVSTGPAIVTPFYLGIEGNVTYQVDDRQPGVIPALKTGNASLIELPRDLIPALKSGLQLTVQVNPVGEATRVQTFSLIGFTAASRWLERKACRSDKMGDKAWIAGESSSKSARIRELRDEAIRGLGWVAGNSYGHAIWPEVRLYVDHGGKYYDFFIRLALPKLDRKEQEAEAFHNVSLYR